MAQSIDLIAGLGNPDPEYLATRHNAGFMFVDALAREHGAAFSTAKKLEADTCDISPNGFRVRLLKPMTFMNHSGRAVARALHFYKLEAARLLVVYDELDLPPGRLQLKFDGGHAGHNGMRDIIQHIGTGFWRLRIGVGHPGDRDRVVGHVLRPAPAAEEELIADGIRHAVAAVPALLELGPERAKNTIHAPRDGSG
jgi:PTH1 family peptidyl-tRNA hydrolase